MYDRQATTFLSHRLGAGAGAAALQSLWPSPPQLHWRSGRLQWCLNPTGSDPWCHARSTAGGVAFMARCGRKKKVHNWQGVSCVIIMSLALRWACPSFTPFNQHFLSFLVISSLFLNSNRHFRFQDLESVPSWVPWWVAWWGLQANGFLPRPPTRRWAGHLASLGQCEVGQLGLGMDWAYRSSNLMEVSTLQNVTGSIAHCFLRAVLTRPFCIQVYLYMYIQARLRAQDNVFIM